MSTIRVAASRVLSRSRTCTTTLTSSTIRGGGASRQPLRVQLGGGGGGGRHRWKSGKSSNGKDLPPTSTSTSTSSPSKAKQEYLRAKEKVVIVNDPHAKIVQMNQEMELVRERAAAKLDTELNKSVYRKLTDPLRRHQHSVINIVAITLAYILAHNWFVTAKREKQIRQECTQAQGKVDELQLLLQSILEEGALQSMAEACAEQVQESTSTSSSSWWWPTSSIRRSSSTNDDPNDLQDRLKDVLQTQLEQRIGDKALTQDQLQEKSIQQVWQEATTIKEDDEDDVERLLLQALQEQSDDNEETKKTRHVFSM
jgi:hypothetical protein